MAAQFYLFDIWDRWRHLVAAACSFCQWQRSAAAAAGVHTVFTIGEAIAGQLAGEGIAEIWPRTSGIQLYRAFQ